MISQGWLFPDPSGQEVIGTFRLDYEYEIEYEYDFRISNQRLF